MHREIYLTLYQRVRSSGQTLTIGQHLILMEFQTLCPPKAGLPTGMLLITSAWSLVAILEVALVVITAYLLWKLMVSQCANAPEAFLSWM